MTLTTRVNPLKTGRIDEKLGGGISVAVRETIRYAAWLCV